MQPNDLAKQCADAINLYSEAGLPTKDAQVTILTPRKWKPHKSFPKTYMVGDRASGQVYRVVNAMDLLAWLAACGFVEVQAEVRK